MAGGKSKKAGPHNMIGCMTCKMWMDVEFQGTCYFSVVIISWVMFFEGNSYKGLTEMSQSERDKLVFDCWKCMVDERVKIADVNMKKEEGIKRLKAEAVSLRRELEEGGKLKGGEDVRSKRKWMVM
ncbi:hypothetical protein FHG87_010644 [Trinorchestia longiramus]|nr:hypothetical protein FHG87_010644 [Trinorchestia longiramus]